MLVSTVTVDDEDFPAAIARHFTGGLLEQLQLEFHAVGNGSGLVLGFKNLPEVVLRKNDGVLLLDRLQGSVPHIEKIRAQRQMRPMLFQDAERQQARAFG